MLRTDAQGRYRVLTIKPGAYPIGGGQVRTPHIHFEVAGHDDRLTTQMYFPGEAMNAADILLSEEPNPAPFMARPVTATAGGPARYVWDIVLASG
jgi:protocatechuate 3,4-dioxygenase beta subunit